MSTLTKGHLSVYPLRVTTRLSADNAFGPLIDRAHALTQGADGIAERWGSTVDEADDLVGSRGVTPPVRLAEIRPDTYTAPDVELPILALRLYWYVFDKPAFEILHNPEPLDYHRLQAADVLITPGADGQSHDVLVTTRTPRSIDRIVVPALKGMYDFVDPAAVVYADDTSMALGDDDIFLWILARSHHAPDVGHDLHIVGVRSVSSEDRLQRAASLSRGVDVDRAELRALITVGARLGPAKFTVRDDLLGLVSEFELYRDGGFTVITGDSWYEDGPKLRDYIGPRIVPDLAFSVLPRLRQAYNGDDVWRRTDRDAYLAEAVQALRAL